MTDLSDYIVILEINLNMRCIEMVKKIVEELSGSMINLNMRCIEISA